MSYEQFIRLGEFLRCYKFGKKLVNIHSIVFFFGLAGDDYLKPSGVMQYTLLSA